MSIILQNAGMNRRLLGIVAPLLAAFLLFGTAIPLRSAEKAKPSLEQALAQLKVPPDWFEATPVNYDTNTPWKEARKEVRRLLSLGGERSREAMKLTCLYREKHDIGDGHEYPMYLYLGGEHAWAIRAYEHWLKTEPKHAIHAYSCLASAYRHFAEYEKAGKALETAMTKLPGPPWRIARTADVHDSFGDLYADMGDIPAATRHYREAMELYPQSDQPWGRHLLHKRAGKTRSKLDMLTMEFLEAGRLHDGVHVGQSLGFGKPMVVTVTVRDHKIVDISVKHEEKIEQGATKIIPQRIIAAQSLKVDGITGATVTVDAILDGALKALRKAGLN